MVQEVTHNPSFYESLAYLYYAVSTVDGSARLQEKRKIKGLVDAYWTFKTDQLDSRQVVFSTLKKLFKEQYDSESAFQQFSRFFLEHRESFTEGLKKTILDTADKIAMSFSKRNKSESVLESRLYFLMWSNK